MPESKPPENEREPIFPPPDVSLAGPPLAAAAAAVVAATTVPAPRQLREAKGTRALKIEYASCHFSDSGSRLWPIARLPIGGWTSVRIRAEQHRQPKVIFLGSLYGFNKELHGGKGVGGRFPERH
jgi:hypothetical protein